MQRYHQKIVHFVMTLPRLLAVFTRVTASQSQQNAASIPGGEIHCTSMAKMLPRDQINLQLP